MLGVLGLVVGYYFQSLEGRKQCNHLLPQIDRIFRRVLAAGPGQV